jgi:hypothetical protein
MPVFLLISAVSVELFSGSWFLYFSFIPILLAGKGVKITAKQRKGNFCQCKYRNNRLIVAAVNHGSPSEFAITFAGYDKGFSEQEDCAANRQRASMDFCK